MFSMPLAVARERDRLSVGGEARLRVVGGPRGERLRGAARDRERVDVAEDVEDERLPVGRDVDRGPGRLAGVKEILRASGRGLLMSAAGRASSCPSRRFLRGGRRSQTERQAEARTTRDGQRLSHPCLLIFFVAVELEARKRGLSPSPLGEACEYGTRSATICPRMRGVSDSALLGRWSSLRCFYFANPLTLALLRHRPAPRPGPGG